MPDRKGLVSTLCVAFSLALLASAVVAPIQTWGRSTLSARYDYLRRNFALPAGQPATCLSAATATDAALQMKALPSEDEEQDGADAPDEPRVSFLIPSSFRKILDRQSIPPLSILSLYPLRC